MCRREHHVTFTTLARNSGGDGSAIHLSRFGGAAIANVVMTNTVIVSHSIGISATSGSTATVRGVLFFGNGIDTGGSGQISVTNSYSGNPLFMPDGYHISSGSGAINNGINTGVTVDIDGDTRPVGPAPDLGADELVRRLFLSLILR